VSVILFHLVLVILLHLVLLVVLPYRGVPVAFYYYCRMELVKICGGTNRRLQRRL
jgi:hypothetical protein